MNDWWVLNMMFIIMWCIFSFTWIVRIIWSCWITMVMLLVNFLTCYWCWIVGVSMYWNMLVLIVEVVWIYALLLLSHRSTHCWCRISYPCWWRILCIQLFGLIIRVVYDVFVASWGDDLVVDMVPHVSRVGLGTLHV